MNERRPHHETDEEAPDYIARQNARDKEYQAEWEAWWTTLSPEEREKLRAAGINGAHVEASGVGAPELDADRLTAPAAEPFAEESEDGKEPLDYMDPRVLERATEMVRAVIGELLSASNKALAVECMAFVTGIAYQGASQTEIAKRHGVTRAAVSKRCIELAAKLGLPPTRAMKSTEVRESLAESQRASHREWMAHEKF